MSEKDSTHEIGLDLADCSRCEGCVELAPHLFEWDDDNDLPRLIRDRAGKEELQELIALCPKDCIFEAD